MQIHPSISPSQLRPARTRGADDKSSTIMEGLDQFCRIGTFGDGAERNAKVSQGEEQFVMLSHMTVAGACRYDEDPKVDKAMGQPGFFENGRCSVHFTGPKLEPTSMHGRIYEDGSTTGYVAYLWDTQSQQNTLAVAERREGVPEVLLLGFRHNADTGAEYDERFKLAF